MSLIDKSAEDPGVVLRRLLLGFAGIHDEPFPAPASPAQERARFERGLEAAKRRTRFIRYAESGAYACELSGLILHLFDARLDGKEGVEQVCMFFEADATIFSACDDSDGSVGQVFTLAACSLLSWYASRCEDDGWLVDRIYAVTREDDYGVRDCLLDHVAEYLPDRFIRDLAGRIRHEAGRASDTYMIRSLYRSIATLAAQLNDGPMYEQAIRAEVRSFGDGDVIPHVSSVEIARVYFKGGDPVTASSWLDRVPDEDNFTAYKRDPLLMEIQRRLGNRREIERIAWRMFRRSRRKETFEELLKILGPSDRERIIDDEARSILNASELSETDALFLMSMGRAGIAERYLLNHVKEFDRYSYPSLLRLAVPLEKEGKFLVASLLYRALLDENLARGLSRYYGHGVRYLRKLDALAPSVGVWNGFPTHGEYSRQLRTTHARKSAFWGRYGERRD